MNPTDGGTDEFSDVFGGATALRCLSLAFSQATFELRDPLLQPPDERDHLRQPDHQLDQLGPTQPLQRLSIHRAASLTERHPRDHSADHA